MADKEEVYHIHCRPAQSVQRWGTAIEVAGCANDQEDAAHLPCEVKHGHLELGTLGNL